MPSIFIADGYTLDGSVKAFRRFPELKFRFRPPLHDEVQEWRYQFDRAASGREQAQATRALLEKHLVSWDAGEAGTTLPITAENLKRVDPQVIGKLLDAVLGYGPEEQEADRKN